MLILNEVQKLGSICLSDKLKRFYLQRCGQPADDFHRLIRTERIFQKFFGVSDTAFRDILLRQTDLVKLLDHFIFCLCCNAFCIGNLQRQFFDFLFLQMLEDLRGLLRTECDQKDCRLLYAADLRISMFTHGLPPVFRQPVAQ